MSKVKVNDKHLLESLQYVLNMALKKKAAPWIEMDSECCGICYNVDSHYYTISRRVGEGVYDRLRVLFRGWKHHSGNEDYPVEDDRSVAAYTFRWDGVNLDKRIDLMQHSIKKLEASIKRANKRKAK